jgi:membrane protein DedA with SNARE-associated domain/rhodanese-related sulfurtransferase
VASFDELSAGHGVVIAGALLLAGAGVPVPIMPTLLMAGALAAAGRLNIALVVAVSPLCLAVGDVLWFYLGRRFGLGILGTLCRISLERDVCVRKTQDAFAVHGLRALLISRFVPGLSTLASPMAGAMRKRFSEFMVYEIAGAVFYSSLYIVLGYLFADQIGRVIEIAGGAGLRLGVALGVVLGVYVGFKFFTRILLIRATERLSISARDADKERGIDPGMLLIDLRGPHDLGVDPFGIPGSKHWREKELGEALKEVSRETPIVLFCGCPNQASSTRVALALRRMGFHNARPLRDGLEGWRAADLPVEPLDAATAGMIAVVP